MSFRARRARMILMWALIAAALVLLVAYLDRTLVRSSYVTGWLLWGTLIGLASFYLRKKLSMLPLGTASSWMQIHIYGGLVALPLLMLHVDWRFPDGRLEQSLAGLFLATWLSGLVGLYLTRTIPHQLAQLGEEYLAEEIPQRLAEVRTEAQQLVFQAVSVPGRSVVGDVYLQHLHYYFERPRTLAYIMYPTSRHRRYLLARLRELERYLAVDGRSVRDDLQQLVQTKDDLDYHAARQALLRLWCFVHIALTGMLLLVGSFHGWMAMAFQGS